jgi:hypothetical protein
MHTANLGVSVLLVAGLSVAAPSAAVAQAVAAAQTAHYSAKDTLVGKLLDDPAAVEILKRLIPTVYANDMFKTAGRERTLKAIQQYEPDALSDENLARIQAEFDKIPVKN